MTELILDHDLGPGSSLSVRVRDGDYQFTCRGEPVGTAQPA
jgi:hypothetical protein